MSVEISPENETRLRAGAAAEGVSVDAYLEQVLNEREELAAIIEQAAARVPQLSEGEMRAKIERGFLQSERGELAGVY